MTFDNGNPFSLRALWFYTYPKDYNAYVSRFLMFSPVLGVRGENQLLSWGGL